MRKRDEEKSRLWWDRKWGGVQLWIQRINSEGRKGSISDRGKYKGHDEGRESSAPSCLTQDQTPGSEMLGQKRSFQQRRVDIAWGWEGSGGVCSML